ncbi:hypothetical protein CsatA_030729 [Cannabis sativa]
MVNMGCVYIVCLACNYHVKGHYTVLRCLAFFFFFQINAKMIFSYNLLYILKIIVIVL